MGANLAKLPTPTPDVEFLVSTVRGLMVKHHGSPGIRDALRTELEELLGLRYPHELGKLDEYVELLYQRLYGLGILERYLEDPEVTDIAVVGTQIMFKRGGVKIDAEECFPDAKAVRILQDRILAPLNKALTVSQPSQDAELYEGSRALLVIPPQSEQPILIIRKHNRLTYTLQGLAENVDGLGLRVEYFRRAVRERKNIVVVGATGAGKTTFVNALGFEIQPKHVVAVLEDTREIRLGLPYVYYFKTREAQGEAKEITYSTILRDCLRADPDRIILTEIRTPLSAYGFIHVLNSGHRGSMTTIHANTCLDALMRTEILIQEHQPLDAGVVRRLIARAVDILVFLEVKEDAEGNRIGWAMTEVVEVNGVEEGEYVLREVPLC
ncbi:MAG: CpaF family protein [Selenomonadales bacterium]|nr:CpaF family protein [Selenomonadales bacterium]